MTDAITGEKRPSSGAFKPDEDGVSVYLESILIDNRLTVSDIVSRPNNLVVAIEVGDVRLIPPLGVHRDPWPSNIPDEHHPRNGAHALIVGWSDLSTSSRKDRQRQLAACRSLEFIYP